MSVSRDPPTVTRYSPTPSSESVARRLALGQFQTEPLPVEGQSNSRRRSRTNLAGWLEREQIEFRRELEAPRKLSAWAHLFFQALMPAALYSMNCGLLLPTFGRVGHLVQRKAT